MADDEFEIDIYGDAGDNQGDHKNDSNSQAFDSNSAIDMAGSGDYESNDMQTDHNTSSSRPNESASNQDSKPPQGIKRKSDSDDRPVDPGATTALLVSELNWWTTDDDIRGWVRHAHCEDELKDITFSEHKVNGKSKGQAYVEFHSQQAATAAKRQIDHNTESSAQPGQKRHAVIYTSPTTNPFKTLPKDAPARAKQQDGGNRSSSGPVFHGNDGGNRGNFGGGGFRQRGNFNRGNMSHGGGGGGGGFNNRNFPGNSSNMGGGGFGSSGMGFNGNMGMGMGGGFGFGGGRGGMGMGGGGMRGGPGGMRGGRGGGGGGGGSGMNGMMGGMPMGGMGMAGMPGPMGGMNMMGGGMGFNGMNAPFGGPPFFGGGSGGSGSSGPNEWQNPHGAKRQRPE